MPRGKTKKSLVKEINKGLELLRDIVREGSNLVQELRTPPAPPSSRPPATRVNAYEIFGLPRDASQKEFKERYRELMRLYHSDRGSGSDAMAKRINQAYEEIKAERGWK